MVVEPTLENLFFSGLVTGAFPIPLSWTRVATGKSLEWRIPRYANYSCNYKSSRLTLLQLNLLPSMSIPVTLAPMEARTLGMYTDILLFWRYDPKDGGNHGFYNAPTLAAFFDLRSNIYSVTIRPRIHALRRLLVSREPVAEVR